MEILGRSRHEEIPNIRKGTMKLTYFRYEVCHILNSFGSLAPLLHKLFHTLSVFEVDHRDKIPSAFDG